MSGDGIAAARKRAERLLATPGGMPRDLGNLARDVVALADRVEHLERMRSALGDRVKFAEESEVAAEARVRELEAAVKWIADWPHVKLYAGNETAYVPLIVHERAAAALSSPPPTETPE